MFSDQKHVLFAGTSVQLYRWGSEGVKISVLFPSFVSFHPVAGIAVNLVSFVVVFGRKTHSIKNQRNVRGTSLMKR